MPLEKINLLIEANKQAHFLTLMITILQVFPSVIKWEKEKFFRFLIKNRKEILACEKRNILIMTKLMNKLLQYHHKSKRLELSFYFDPRQNLQRSKPAPPKKRTDLIFIPFIIQIQIIWAYCICFDIQSMQKGLLLKKSVFIKESKENIGDYYDIDPKEIGCGAYGKVYTGRKKQKPNNTRAIKMIKKQFSNSQFTSEVPILKVLDHPNLLKLYQIFEDNQNIYLVTDYFEGGDLFQRLQSKGQFTQQQAKDIFRQVLEAVSYCHSQKIAHRDIKPQNLMFLNKNSLGLKLIDFGLAIRWNQDLKKQVKKFSKTTGSVYYIAPQVLSNNYSQKCDIWSLGVVLYVLVTAQFPFDGQSDKQIMQNIQTSKFTTEISTINGSNDLKDLLKKLLSKQSARPTAFQIFDHPWLSSKQNTPLLKLNFKKLSNFSKFSKMKTLAVTFIASQLPQKEIEKLATLFKQLDLNHDGYLSMEQLRVAFERQKQKSSLVELSQLIKFVDTDKNGKINYTEFISGCLQNSVIFREQNLKAAFKLLDRDQNGKIQRKELLSLLKQSSLTIDASVIEQMIKVCDKNGDGFIDYKEFVQNISKH